MEGPSSDYIVELVSSSGSFFIPPWVMEKDEDGRQCTRLTEISVINALAAQGMAGPLDISNANTVLCLNPSPS